MPQAPEELALNDAMTKLETALLTPLVSGELDTWVETVLQAADDLGPLLRQYADVVTHPQYAQIGSADPELLTHVQQLTAEDAKLALEYEAFRRSLDEIVKRVPLVGKHESKVKERRAQIEAEGVAMILHIRKQQAGASTWLSEAFYRDRGQGD